MKYRWLVNIVRILIVTFILLLAFWLIYGQDWYDNYKNSHKPVGDHAPISLSTWVVDWDFDASTEDMKQLYNKWSSIQLFLGYFDEQDQIIWNDDLQALITKTRAQLSTDKQESTTPLYLTIVNDIVKQDGSSVQKDEGLVERIIATPESQYTYIEHLIRLVQDNNLDGLEMDFENISSEKWPQLVAFYEMLYRRLASENIPLRIVLEPKVDFAQLEFPDGPQYVVMAYNLYGFHSDAGPKADRSFLGKLTARMESIPGDATVAIATGGFDWDQNGLAKALTEEEATQLLLSATSGTVRRDEASGAQTFNYADDQGNNHTVWFADAETLRYWIEIIQQRGYSSIAIWRMGNISDQSLTMLKEL
ncbi:glycosyl hydrolase family 18 protein [Paenibacillus endoradicis]|uniref:glycosyl hydrolase family 18 protein n=1 Tax=Paenibacillus endoradicis TaxID=2972487 RepID=UPI002158DB4E|nr:glycosyl hydrolase family 18 protein [Paenibacillus endoradicis]MCR8656980.1 glycosyl hydrolase family 18 protein [Paenibacillus endoradicis]